MLAGRASVVNGRERAVVLGLIQANGHANLPQVTGTGGLICTLPHLAYRRNQYRGENTDNRDYSE